MCHTHTEFQSPTTTSPPIFLSDLGLHSLLGTTLQTMGLFRTLTALLGAIGSIPRAASKSSRLDFIELPVGFMPEGIALAEEWTVFVGSLLGERLRANLACSECCGPRGSI